MEKTYTINWLEKKTTSTGKAYISLTLEEEGAKKITIWSDFPHFADLMPGHQVTGELKQNDKGYWNLYPPRTGKTGNSGAFKTKLMNDAMERKEASIERFQGSKEESIKLAGAQRDAVLLVTTFGKDLITDGEVKEAIVKWRNWFLSKDFEDHPPF